MRSLILAMAATIAVLSPLTAHANDSSQLLQLPPFASPRLDQPADVPPRAEPSLAVRSALKQYALQHVGLEDLYSGDDDGTSSYTLQPYVGKYHQLLDPDQFYEMVGRQDLADSYRFGEHLRTGLLVGSVVVWLGGGALGVAQMASGSNASQCAGMMVGADACMQQADQDQSNHIRDGVLLEVGAAVVGSGLLVAGLVYDPNPAPASQMRQLADEYNTRLRARLGLPEDDDRMGTVMKLLESMQLTPYANPTGGGLSVRGGF